MDNGQWTMDNDRKQMGMRSHILSFPRGLFSAGRRKQYHEQHERAGKRVGCIFIAATLVSIQPRYAAVAVRGLGFDVFGNRLLR
jgi:hypothetical protein